MLRTRNPRPRLRACADEIEVRDLIVAIVHAEPRALGQGRLQAEGAAEMRVQIGRKVVRRVVEFGDDPLMDVGTSLAYWMDVDDPEEMRGVLPSITALPGSLSRAEVLARYVTRTGRAMPTPG